MVNGLDKRNEIRLPYQFSMIEIMKYMGGWDYQTFLNQPRWLIEYIAFKMELENIKLEKKNG